MTKLEVPIVISKHFDNGTTLVEIVVDTKNTLLMQAVQSVTRVARLNGTNDMVAAHYLKEAKKEVPFSPERTTPYNYTMGVDSGGGITIHKDLSNGTQFYTRESTDLIIRKFYQLTQSIVVAVEMGVNSRTLIATSDLKKLLRTLSLAVGQYKKYVASLEVVGVLMDEMKEATLRHKQFVNNSSGIQYHHNGGCFMPLSMGNSSEILMSDYDAQIICDKANKLLADITTKSGRNYKSIRGDVGWKK